MLCDRLPSVVPTRLQEKSPTLLKPNSISLTTSTVKWKLAAAPLKTLKDSVHPPTFSIRPIVNGAAFHSFFRCATADTLPLCRDSLFFFFTGNIEPGVRRNSIELIGTPIYSCQVSTALTLCSQCLLQEAKSKAVYCWFVSCGKQFPVFHLCTMSVILTTCWHLKICWVTVLKVRIVWPFK